MSNNALRAGFLCFLCLCLNAFPACPSDRITPYTGGIKPYARGAPAVSKPNVRAGIVSHHGLASEMIARFYEGLGQHCDVESIILLGPDHFRAGHRSISVCPLPWQTAGKTINFNVQLLQELIWTNIVSAKSLPFRMEHSIGLHIDFIGHYFTDVQVTALMIKNEASLFELAKLVPILARAMGERTLLILSMDFSHGKTPEKARRSDEKSVERILAFRTEELRDLDIDAPRAAWLFLEVLKHRGIIGGTVSERTNSGEIAGRPGAPCTGYATVVFY